MTVTPVWLTVYLVTLLSIPTLLVPHLDRTFKPQVERLRDIQTERLNAVYSQSTLNSY